MDMHWQLQGRNTASGDPAQSFPTRYVRFGDFQLDVKRQDLLKNGSRTRLPGKVCQVLIALLERPGEIVTREELRDRLWASDTHVNFEANVNTTVNKLRQILGDSSEESAYVQTVPRRGYSFIRQVEFIEQPAFLELRGRDAAEPVGHLAAAGAATDAIQPPPAVSRQAIPPQRAKAWFTAGVIALVVAAVLFGAAVTLFSYRPF